MSSRLQFLALLVLFTFGCGPRTLELSLSIDPSCAVQLPAGGSLAYELISDVKDAGVAPTLCGGCITTNVPITDGTILLDRLRQAAPSCAVARGATLRARVIGFTGGACSSGGTSPVFCAASSATVVGDGRSDASFELSLRCDAQCVPTGCVSTSCAAQAKNCDQAPDGCGNTLDCGICKPPEKCGGAGLANVCGR